MDKGDYMEYKLEYMLAKGLVKFTPNPNCEKYELYRVETNNDGSTLELFKKVYEKK